MADISLDNIVMYEYPQPKKSSKLPVIPYGTSSFQSCVISPATGPLPTGSCASVLESVSPDVLAEDNPSFIRSPSFHNLSGGINQPTGAESVHSDTDKGYGLGDIAIGLDGYQNKTKSCDDNLDPAEATNAQEMSTGGKLAPMRSPGRYFLSRDSDDEQRGSTIPESPSRETPPGIGNERTVTVEPPGTDSADQASNSAAVTVSVSESCLNNSTIAALTDNDNQPPVHRTSPIDESAVPDFAPFQSQRSVSSKRSCLNRLQQSTSRRTVSRSPSSTIARRELRPGNTSHAYQHSRLSLSAQSTESDDSEDNDYCGHSNPEDQVAKPRSRIRPIKRRRRIENVTNSFRQRRGTPQERAHSAASLPSPPRPEPIVESLTSPETIRIDGRLARKVSLSRVEYCCWFTEDLGSIALDPAWSDCLASFQGQADKGDQQTSMSDLQIINIEGLFTRTLEPFGYTWTCSFKERYTPPQVDKPSHHEDFALGENDSIENDQADQLHETPVSAKGKEYSAQEDELIVHLKEVRNLRWPDIAAQLPGRTQNSLQVRYSTRLKKKGHKKWRNTERTRRGKSRVDHPQVTGGRQQRIEKSMPRDRYSLRLSRRSPDRYSPQ